MERGVQVIKLWLLINKMPKVPQDCGGSAVAAGTVQDQEFENLL